MGKKKTPFEGLRSKKKSRRTAAEMENVEIESTTAPMQRERSTTELIPLIEMSR